jgi:glycosyltransferase involved in cell wall biosynthesis
MQSTHHRKIISHFVGLSGIGGVQSNFIEYMNNIVLNPSKYHHKVYTFGSVDSYYQLTNDVLDIRKISNLYRLILDIVSKDVVVHLYNNFSSFKVALLLALLPIRKLIVHERGTIWNQQTTSWLIPRFVAWKASIILSNSFATKTMLVKKFSIPSKKIRVLHNGINTLTDHNCGGNHKKNKTIFHIGFIGRLDSHKGVHLLIEAMHFLKNENIKLIIAGEGVLESALKKSASKLSNVEFIGRVNSPYLFLNKIDLLVVPSIREPLGNVCLEAGMCRTPVLAANVDGIPEIIEHGVTGELIDATDEILVNFSKDALPLPEFVVNPTNQQLCTPKQINSSLLAKRILELSSKPEQLSQYADRLYKKVTNHFNIHRYRTELHSVYQELFFS